MFDKKKYLTRGVQDKISFDLQLFMWNMIDEISIQKDYLQVFKLESRNADGKKYQYIRHFQEVPEYSKEVVFQSDNPVSCKNYVMANTMTDWIEMIRDMYYSTEAEAFPLSSK